MRISDWSSDVCSSDLLASGSAVAHVEFIDHEVVDLGDRGEQTFPVRPQEREGANAHLAIPGRGNEIGRLFVDRKGLHLRLPLRIEQGKAKNGAGGAFRTRGTPTLLTTPRPLLSPQRSTGIRLAPIRIYLR